MSLATCKLTQEFSLVDPYNSYLAFDLASNDFYFLIVIVLITITNLSVCIVCLLEASEEKKWRKSDIALCYKLNMYYASSGWVRWVKFGMLAIYVLAVGELLATALIEGLFIDILYMQLLPSITAALALTSLHTPSPGLEGVAFSVYKKTLEDESGFAYADLTYSAPALLVAKLTAAALEDVQEESQELRDEQGAALSS